MAKQIILLIVLIFFSSAFLMAQEPAINITDKIAKQESNYFKLKTNFAESAGYSDYDLIYQRMEWEINPEIYYINGAVTSHFISKTAALSEIGFDLHAELIVDSIIQNNQPLIFSRAENRITIELGQALSGNETDSLTIFYQGEPADSGFGSFARKSHNGVPIIWTLSEPYGALDWWPCKQSLSDKIDSIDIIVTSPEQYRTASNGVLVSETVNNGLRRMHWQHRYPIAAYLVAIAVTNYIDYSDFVDLEDGRQIEIQNFVYPEDESYARENTPKTIEIMEHFNNLIGEYPFADEKYGHAQFSWGGGMEHQTMSFMFNFGFELVAHELAHQWFGDYITLGSWQDIWLNEGFATYLSGLAYENIEVDYWQHWKRLNVERIVSQPGGSVFVQDTTSVGRLFSSRLSYSKGAYLLHMLRWVLGDEAFFQAVRNYFEDPEVANGFARTSQFVNHLETAGDTSLTEFFDDWFYGEGYPVYSAQFKNTASQQIEITLTQTTSHESVPFFEMPVPVRVYNSSKTDSANFRLNNHTKNSQQFIVDVGFEVAELKIDPEYWLVSKTENVVKSPISEKQEEVKIYPNPFTHQIFISFHNQQQFQRIELFNSTGTSVSVLNPDQKTFDLSFLPDGIYILQLQKEDIIIEKKIVKQ